MRAVHLKVEGKNGQIYINPWSTKLGLEGCSGVQYSEKQFEHLGDRMGRTHDRHETGINARSRD